jgi:hypothetical protein
MKSWYELFLSHFFFAHVINHKSLLPIGANISAACLFELVSCRVIVLHVSTPNLWLESGKIF